jgi:hypothetical protein
VTRCSEGSLAAGEQLAGSAPESAAWVALEQNGPWGAKAFTASHLDPGLGREIEAAAAAHRVRPVLVRRPGRHADDHAHTGGRRVLVAYTHPASTWLLDGILAGPEELLSLNWTALRAGDRDAVRRSLPALRPSAEAQLLVCTNGARDLCCAVVGRPVALAAAALRPGRVWEVTHTSGHRFAPTAVLLPAGTLHGRLDAARADALLAAADRDETVLAGSRGRSTWPGPGQVAELAVRDVTGELGLSAVQVTGCEATGEHTWRVDVAHADGRRWRVQVTSEATGNGRAESCAKPAVPLRRWMSVEPRLLARR